MNGTIMVRWRQSATGQVSAQKWVNDPQPVLIQNVPVLQPTAKSNKMGLEQSLSKATEKAIESIAVGSRIAFNRITMPDQVDKTSVQDLILETLLDNNYKVVAKEYLETLKEELDEQQSGLYSERTKVKENNLSASGYLLDCKIVDKIIRIYIINVSTGEYVSTSKVEYQ